MIETPPPMRFAADLLRDKVALVTGGGTGMGRAIAVEMARSGAKLVLMGRRPEPLRDTVAFIASLGGTALALPGDTREAEQIEAAMRRIGEVHGRLDILVNNAGGQYISPARDITTKGFEAVIRNNLIASWLMTKAAADHFMLAHGGRVVFITAAIRSGAAGFVHTAAARGGVTAMMKTLATEWAEFGILLNCVAPGTIRTEGMDQYPISPEQWLKLNRNILGRMGKPADVAGAVMFLVSALGDFVTGEDWYIDGGETLHLAHDGRAMIDEAKFKARLRADGTPKPKG